MLESWLVLKRENDHVTDVATLKETEWSCYGGCHFNGGRKVIRGSEVVSLMEGMIV